MCGRKLSLAPEGRAREGILPVSPQWLEAVVGVFEVHDDMHLRKKRGIGCAQSRALAGGKGRGRRRQEAPSYRCGWVARREA